MIVFIFYETEPLTAFELQLLDPRFQLNLDGNFELCDIELVISHDDLGHSVRAFALPGPLVAATTGSPSL